MKRSFLFFVFVLSSSIAFSQGLAFSQILMVPEDVQGTTGTSTISGDPWIVVQVPQGKVWKITSVPNESCNTSLMVGTNLNPNGLNPNSLIQRLEDFYHQPNTNNSDVNWLSPQPAIWLGENHSLSFDLAGTSARCGMLNVIEYDVVP